MILRHPPSFPLSYSVSHLVFPPWPTSVFKESIIIFKNAFSQIFSSILVIKIFGSKNESKNNQHRHFFSSPAQILRITWECTSISVVGIISFQISFFSNEIVFFTNEQRTDLIYRSLKLKFSYAINVLFPTMLCHGISLSKRR